MEDKLVHQAVRDPEDTLAQMDLRDLTAKKANAEKREMLVLREVVVFPEVSAMKELLVKRVTKGILAQLVFLVKTVQWVSLVVMVKMVKRESLACVELE